MELRIRARHVHGSFVARENRAPAVSTRHRLDGPPPEFIYDRLAHPPAIFRQEKLKTDVRLPAARKYFAQCIAEHTLNEIFEGSERDVGLVLQGGLYNGLIPGARHDVGPVAGLVLLQQEESLVLLGLEPLERLGDARRQPAAQPPGGAAPLEEVERDQPPKRGVDAAEVPEVGLPAAHVDELGDLAVAGLVLGEGQQSGCGLLLEHWVARQRHADCADRGVAPENRHVAALFGSRVRGCGEDALRREVFSQQRYGALAAGLDQRVAGRRRACRATGALFLQLCRAVSPSPCTRNGGAAPSLGSPA